MQPSTKATVQNVGIGGALAVLVLGTLSVFFPEQVSALPNGYEAALGAVLGVVAAALGGALGKDPE